MIRNTVLLVMLAINPILRRADRDDADYRALGSRYSALVSLGRRGDGVLIAPRWVLTAGHVAQGAAMTPSGPRSVRIGKADYLIADVFIHPEWTEMGPHDVGLILLAKPVVGVTPLSLYRERKEKGQIAVLLGHGKSGVGSSRARIEDDQARGATSKIDSTDRSWLYFSFDAPPRGTRLEGAPGPGDSGGPALLEIKGRSFVAGISSAGYDGVNGPGSYGAVDVFTRVSTHVTWIDRVMKAGSKKVISAKRDTGSGRSWAPGI